MVLDFNDGNKVVAFKMCKRIQASSVMHKIDADRIDELLGKPTVLHELCSENISKESTNS